MKYKCIKDYWMDGESEENGNIPAFAAGEVYDFDYWNTGDDTMITYKDNHRREHFMDKDELENSGHFELVGE